MKLMKIIQCGRQTVRVIQPDGQITQLFLPATVADLLRLHPHHYVSQATLRKGEVGGRGGCIMPPEAQLESGGIYLLSPLPRLFPSSTAAAPPLPCPCPCFTRVSEAEDDAAAVVVKCGPSIWVGKRHWGFAVSKISPEGVGTPLSLRDGGGSGGGGGSKAAQAGGGGGAAVKRSRLWEPSLEMIVENEEDENNLRGGAAAEDEGEAAATMRSKWKDKKGRERRQTCGLR